MTKKNVDPRVPQQIHNLQKYYSFLTPSELISKYATQSVKSSQSSTLNDRVAGVIMDALFNTSAQGIYSLEDLQLLFDLHLKSSIKNESESALSKEFHKLIRIGADGLKLKDAPKNTVTLAQAFGMTAAETSVNNPDFKIGYIMSNSPRLSLGVRDTHSITAFLNAIPTVEFSRAVPYLTLNFKTTRPTLEKDRYLAAPTMLRFLRGSEEVLPGSVDETLVTATSNTGINGVGFDQLGMEVFTSPVTMTPFNTRSDPALRSTRINDPFRPIMSIDSLNIEVIPTVGVYQYKTANLSLTLHDKSRLSEVSDLVRPEGFGGASPDGGIEITYGWSHPDDVTTGNVYGTLLNRMRVTEVFSIINSKYVVDAVGQVKITLSLATKGGYDVHRSKILDATLQSEAQQLEKLRETIRELRDKSKLRATTDAMKEIGVFQVLDAAEAGERPNLKEFSKKLDEALKMLRTEGKGKADNAKKISKELAKALEDLYSAKDESGQTGGLLGKMDRSLNSAIAARFSYISNVTSDPFLEPLSVRKNDPDKKLPWDEEIEKFNSELKGKVKNGLVSLGHLLMTFVGTPMMANRPANEVQFVFHTFNDYAGLAGGENIAMFPVEFEYFKDIFQKLARSRRDPNYTLEEFTRMLSEHIINNPRSVGYGMRSLYVKSVDKDDENALPKIELDRNLKPEQVTTVTTHMMKKEGGSFKFPILEAYVETLPRRKMTSDNEDAEVDGSYNIMRIHIYDKQATPYETVFDLKAAARGDQLLAKGTDDSPAKEGGARTFDQAVITAFARYIEDMRAADTSEKKSKVRPPDELTKDPAAFKAGPNIIVPASADMLRDFIRETVPTITYGSNLSTVKSAELSSLQDAQQQAVFLKRAGRTNPAQPNGSDLGGMPVTILPTTLNMTTVGCPIMALMQQFFVDFGTGTTADNVYFVTGLTHEISAGKFETRIKFAPGDAYGRFRPIKDAIKQMADLLKRDD